MSIILLSRGRWGVVVGRYDHAILGARASWDYYSSIAVLNLLSVELCVEFVHHGLLNRRLNKNSIGFEVVKSWKWEWKYKWRILEVSWPRLPLTSKQ